jgi:hypothetical protein
MKSKIIFVLFIFGLCAGTAGLSQHKHDAHFVMGYWSDSGPEKDPIISFSKDTVDVDYNKIALGFDLAGSNISDQKGNLLFYFNGCDIANKYHQIIDNGRGFNPGKSANNTCPGNNGYASGYQSTLILPMDDDDKQFMILHHTKEYVFIGDTVILYSIPRYSIVDMSANQGGGKVTLKNQIYLADTTLSSGNIVAVKHENNKDWWIIMLDQDGSNNYYRVLLRDGVLIPMGNQQIGKPWYATFEAQSGFSSDGTRYFRYSGKDGLVVMDFDRSSGMFSHYRHMLSIANGWLYGGSFSPDGKFVYFANGIHLIQAEIDSTPFLIDTVAVWDGTAATWGQPAYFGAMQLGMDCRIYMTTGYCVPFMHVIMEPNKKGKACDVRQHFYTFKVPVCNIPNFPNFRLGTPYDFCNPDIVVISSTNQVLDPTPQNRKITIYPNPAHDVLNINIKTYENTTNLLAHIINADGKVVSEVNLQKEINNIDISALNSGVYTVTVMDQNQTVFVSKFIKIQ